MIRPGFVSGLTSGAFLAFLAATIIDFGLSDRWATVVVGLATVLGALAAASWAWHGVQRQIEAQGRLSESQRLHDLAAARALLPLVLSDLTQKARNCAETCLNPELDLSNPNAKETIEKLISVDPDALAVLRDCIRSADPVSAEWLATILRLHQVCAARTVGMFAPNLLVTDNNFAEHAADWIKLMHVVEHCFRFARGEEAEIPAELSAAKLVPWAGSNFWAYARYALHTQALEIMRASIKTGRSQEWFS